MHDNILKTTYIFAGMFLVDSTFRLMEKNTKLSIFLIKIGLSVALYLRINLLEAYRQPVNQINYAKTYYRL
jgi:hypothetical protein